MIILWVLDSLETSLFAVTGRGSIPNYILQWVGRAWAQRLCSWPRDGGAGCRHLWSGSCCHFDKLIGRYIVHSFITFVFVCACVSLLFITKWRDRQTIHSIFLNGDVWLAALGGWWFLIARDWTLLGTVVRSFHGRVGLLDPWQIDRLNIWFVVWFIHSFIHSFIPSFVHSFIPSFIRSFVGSFIHPFMDSSIHQLNCLLIASSVHYCVGGIGFSARHCRSRCWFKRSRCLFSCSPRNFWT